MDWRARKDGNTKTFFYNPEIILTIIDKLPKTSSLAPALTPASGLPTTHPYPIQLFWYQGLTNSVILFIFVQQFSN